MEVDEDNLTGFKSQCSYLSLPCDEDIHALCTFVLNENGLSIPDRNMEVEDAVKTYKFLINELLDYGLD